MQSAFGITSFITTNSVVPTFFIIALSCLALLSSWFTAQTVKSARRSFILLLQAALSNKTAEDDAFSPERALAAFKAYEEQSLVAVYRMQNSLRRLSREHKRIAYDIGYPQKLQRLCEATKENSRITHGIAQGPQLSYSASFFSEAQLNGDEVVKVREALRHIVRDWSSEGAQERHDAFKPILDVLFQVSGVQSEGGKRVLVPGCGLGRLAWEIAQLGFTAEAIELSPYMTLALRFLLSPSTTQHVNQYTVYPYSHWFSHQRNNRNLFRSIKFPDVIPREDENFKLIEGDFFKFPAQNESYDFIVTLFFIDTSANIISTLQRIFALLKPGGKWVNLGPLLWTSGAQSALELSLEEVLKLASIVGFELDGESRKTVECEYTKDDEAMMRWVYSAEFWVARKRAL